MQKLENSTTEVSILPFVIFFFSGKWRMCTFSEHCVLLLFVQRSYECVNANSISILFLIPRIIFMQRPLGFSYWKYAKCTEIGLCCRYELNLESTLSIFIYLLLRSVHFKAKNEICLMFFESSRNIISWNWILTRE